MNIRSYTTGIFFSMMVLVVLNVYLFLKGVSLSNEISYYEGEMRQIEEENREIENKLYELQSVTEVSSRAAELGFYEYNDPMYIQTQPRYAFSDK